MDRETNILGEEDKKVPEKIDNKCQHIKRWKGVGLLSLSVAEVVCCIGMPFLFVPVGIFAFADFLSGIAFLVPYFDRDSSKVQSEFREVIKPIDIIRQTAWAVFGICLCCGAPFCAPITALLASFGWFCELTVKVGLMVYSTCPLIVVFAPRLPRNLWIFFKNGIISLIPGIYKGSFGKAIAISFQEIRYRNEHDTVEGFDINKVINPQLDDSDMDKSYNSAGLK